MASEPGLREKGKAIILVVDRDPHVRELESHFLDQAGYTVAFEQDGNIALAQARKIVPDIIITEILVPKLDGLALCRQLKADARTRDIAVLVTPLAEHTLVGTVRQLLEARSARIRRAQDER